MKFVKLSSIVAVSENYVIGKNNELLWHISEDFKHFKRVTMGKPLIMGRKTFESLPSILPGRAHIIISRSKSIFSTQQKQDGKSISSELYYEESINPAIKKGKSIAVKNGVDEIFIVGGGEIYKQTLPIINRLYLTLVHKKYEGDTFFPEFDWNEWRITSEDRHEAPLDKKHPAFTFFILDRK